MRAGSKPLPESGFAVGDAFTSVAVPVESDRAAGTTTVSLRPVQPAAFATRSAALPPRRAQTTATTARLERVTTPQSRRDWGNVARRRGAPGVPTQDASDRAKQPA